MKRTRWASTAIEDGGLFPRNVTPIQLPFLGTGLRSREIEQHKINECKQGTISPEVTPHWDLHTGSSLPPLLWTCPQACNPHPLRPSGLLRTCPRRGIPSARPR